MNQPIGDLPLQAEKGVLIENGYLQDVFCRLHQPLKDKLLIPIGISSSIYDYLGSLRRFDRVPFSVHNPHFYIRVGIAQEAILVFQPMASLQPDHQAVGRTSCMSGVHADIHLVLLLVSQIRKFSWWLVDLTTCHHVIHIGVLLFNILVRPSPHLVPIFLEDLLCLLLVVNHHAPLRQVCDVKVLRAYVVRDVIYTKELRVVGSLFSLFPVTGATAASHEGHLQVPVQKARRPLFDEIFTILLHCPNDHGLNVFTRPPVAIIGLQHGKIAGPGVRVADYDVHIHATLVDGSRNLAQVVLWPHATRNR
mmetsp:Transcript_53018/g.141726  ORF Transcript_53018/g.141726 Transcript_53018/m.141726 type:complete len:307 (+) Transcript_53018:331-1251(+)